MRIQDLELKPRGARFPAEVIRAHLKGLDHVALDPITESLLMIGLPGEGLETGVRLRSETGRFHASTVVSVEPDSVEILRVLPETSEYCRAFAQWMLDRFDCIVLDDFKNDVTEKVAKDASVLYPPPSKR